MMNEALAFHGSELDEIDLKPEVLRLSLTAYVHVSNGRAGVDRGKAFIKPVEIELREPHDAEFPQAPCAIFDGEIECDGETLSVPKVPFDHRGPVRLTVRTAHGVLTSAGNGISIVARGEGAYVEDFHGLD